MNAKLCKKLRRAVRSVTQSPHQYRQTRQQLIVDPMTQKGLYHQLKRDAFILKVNQRQS